MAAPLPGLTVVEKVAVLGVPFDANSSFAKGAASAPDAIRRCLDSPAGNAYSETGAKVWPAESVTDHGNLELRNVPADREPFDQITQAVGQLLDTASTVLVLGGDHAVSYPVVQAVAARHGPVDILHFDAHPDLYPELDGNRLSHACPFARILEENLAHRLIQIGIRSYAREQATVAEKYGVSQYRPGQPVPDGALNFDRPLYISVDLDALDPAFAPGVSHLEPGGMTTREVLGILSRVRAPMIVGADLVELNPERDLHGLSAATAAKITRELLATLINQ